MPKQLHATAEEPAGDSLFPDASRPAAAPLHTTGLLPSQVLREMVRAGEIAAMEAIGADQIQPASMDLRLGRVAYRVRASFLPGGDATVAAKLDLLGSHEIDLSQGALLECGGVYIVPLMEHLNLPSRVSGIANPKSSSGRLDLFTRLIADNAQTFDQVPAGYTGPLYAEIAPRTFGVLVRQGARLNQLRLKRGNPKNTDKGLRELHAEVPLVDDKRGPADIYKGAIAVTIDLEGTDPSGLIGYRARRHTDLIDLDRIDHYEPLDFWEPIYRRDDGRLILDPSDFYILASREAVTVPPDHAAEMFPYNPLIGEFRAHYAGFFDPGFGYAEAGGTGSRAVLEIRSHEVPFVMEHGQVVARLIYERLTEVPDRIYGRDIGSNYQRQGLKLSKQFRRSRSP